MALRTRVFEILDEQGRRQNWLAKRLGWSEPHLSRVKNRREPMSRAFIEKCVEIFDLPESVLFYEEPGAAPFFEDGLRDGNSGEVRKLAEAVA